MHVPAHFAEDRREVIVSLVRHAGFGHLAIAGDDGLVATPLPFVADDDLAAVRAHVARANGVWRAAPAPALLIVPVSDVFVSPSWYPRKAEHGEVVPTWNYEVVHLHGRLVAHDDDAWVDRQVRELTDLHEGERAGRGFEAWSVDDAPSAFVARQRRGIVGLELVVERVEAKRKLSQHRGDEEIDAVVAALRAEAVSRAGGGRAVADAMERAADGG